ncbi:hypothetical protein [Rhodococcus jostii]|uniref:hypothetical protein n=1 Tax=Rhodococcus jostii TaxID=132919 RepID=UPI001F0720FC|nr:hypothetical protein [Rhodococcus jostii]
MPRVLVVSLELCSLHLQKSHSLETMLSFLVFGDGCAAVLISADEEGIALNSFNAVMVPDTADLIAWRIGGIGFDMVLSGKVPGALSRALDEQNLKTILAGANKESIDLWAVHPVGRSILDAVEDAVGLAPDALAASRHVTRRSGGITGVSARFGSGIVCSRTAVRSVPVGDLGRLPWDLCQHVNQGVHAR